MEFSFRFSKKEISPSLKSEILDAVRDDKMLVGLLEKKG